MRTINEIIIHCSATHEGVSFNAADIRRWHKQRGFRDIGYHYVVLLDGTVENGRPTMEQGAHCKAGGHNRNSIGICYIGGLAKNGKPKDTRTEAQRRSLQTLVRVLKNIWPQATVHGHREFANVECPCFDVRKEF